MVGLERHLDRKWLTKTEALRFASRHRHKYQLFVFPNQEVLRIEDFMVAVFARTLGSAN